MFTRIVIALAVLLSSTIHVSPVQTGAQYAAPALPTLADLSQPTSISFPAQVQQFSPLNEMSASPSACPAVPVSTVTPTPIATSIPPAPSATPVPPTVPTPTSTPSGRSIFVPFVHRSAVRPNRRGQTIPPAALESQAATGTFAAAAHAVFVGQAAPQRDVAAGAISDACVSVLRGRVQDRAGSPVVGVQISIVDAPQYGTTQTAINGEFFIAVNGGGLVTVRYAKEGYLRADRQVQAPYQDYAVLGDVALVPLDAQVTTINASAGDMQVVQGSVSNDTDGQRRATLLIPAGTQAEMVLADGSRQPLTTMSVRATEFTIGTSGPDAMPSDLPPNSGYTYALEYSVDQAEAAGAVDVRFNKPLYHYVDNFLNFPVGETVPMGFYDRTQKRWVPSDSGKVIKIVSIANGLAEIDTDGNGAADNDPALGFTDAERQKLATLYSAGKTLWRVPITHFTPWDCNWPFGPPQGAQGPDENQPPDDDTKPPDKDDCATKGSIIRCQSQALGERIGILGAPFDLVYSSNYMPGRLGNATLRIPLSSSAVPTGLKHIELEVIIAGRKVESTHAAQPGQTTQFVWDGIDALGNTVNGQTAAKVRVGYAYDGVYQRTGRFASSGNGLSIDGSQTRQEVTLWREWTIDLGAYLSAPGDVGGWGLNILHRYDRGARSLLNGGGAERSATSGSTSAIGTFAGGGATLGDGLIATNAKLNWPEAVAFAPDGSVYIADTNNMRVRRVRPDGTITTVAGTGTCCSVGDGKVARQARLYAPSDIVFASDGSYYIADRYNDRIRKVGVDGIITTVAGTGISEGGFSGDGGLAISATLNSPSAVAIGPDGTLYIADELNKRVRRILANGTITTVAGNGVFDIQGEGVPAVAASLRSPNAIAIDSSGNLFIADAQNPRIRRVDAATGIISIFAGNGSYGSSGDGGPALAAEVGGINDLKISADNQLYLTSSSSVRRIDLATRIITNVVYVGDQPNALAFDSTNTLNIGAGGNLWKLNQATNQLSKIAGTGRQGFAGDGGDALAATFNGISAIAPRPDGSIFVADSGNERIRRITPDGKVDSVVGAEAQGDGGPATLAELGNPTDVKFDASGNLLIVDSQDQRIRRVSSAGIIQTVAGMGYSTLPCSRSSRALEAKLCFDGFDGSQIAPSSDGSIYLPLNDFSSDHVLKIDASSVLTVFAGAPSLGVYTGQITSALGTPLNDVGGMTVDRQGQLVFHTHGFGNTNCYLVRVNTSGQMAPVAGQPVCGKQGDGGSAKNAQISTSAALYTGPDGSLYVGDATNGVVRRILDNGSIATVAGGGLTNCSVSPFTCGDGGPATDAVISQPRGMAVGSDGSIYIADIYNNRVRRVRFTLPGLGNTDFTVISEDGREAYGFTASGQHIRTVDALTGSPIYTFGYDTNGRLTSVTDAYSNITTIERNAAGAPTAIGAPYGQRTVLGVNADGFLSEVTDPAGQTTRMSYGSGGLLTSFTSPRGFASTYTHDALGRLTTAQNAAGGSTTLARASIAGGFTVSSTSALGRTTAYAVKPSSLGPEQRTSTSPSGNQASSARDLSGGMTWGFADGRSTKTTLAADPRWLMQAPIASSTTVSMPSGLSSVTTQQRTATVTTPTNPFSLQTQTDALTVNGRTYRSVYTASSRTFVDTTPAGRTRTTVIDANGRVTSEQLTGLASVAYGYDAHGRITSASVGSGAGARTFTFAYNAQGYLESITDPLGRQSSYAYDAAGRVTQETLPGGRSIAYAYDANGNITGLTPPGKPQHQFAYTAIDQMQSYTPPAVGGAANAATQYQYDLDRQPTQITRPGGDMIGMSYDAAGRVGTISFGAGNLSYTYNAGTGRLASVTAPGGQTLSYSYDGSLIQRVQSGGAVVGSVEFGYDTDFRVVSTTVNGATPVAFRFDSDGLLTNAGALTLTRSSQTGLVAGARLDTLAETMGYNTFGEPASYAATTSGSPLLGFSYTHDALGRITQRVETIGGVTATYAYAYDDAGRLSEVRQNGSVAASYTYDANGNRLSVTTPGGTTNATYDAQDRLLTFGGNSYGYAANGELQTKTSGGQTTSYSYDALSNLRGVTLPNGTPISYVIDGQNRRVGKKVNGVQTQGFLYESQLRPVAELDGNNAIVARFVYGSKVNVPEYMVKGGVTYRLLTDHLGSVRLVVNSSTGAIAQRLDYDAWGRVTQDTSPGFQPFGFAGGLYDAQTGLVRFGARDYDAEAGRWTAKDPIGFAGGDMNLFRYVLGNVINVGDPKGLDSPGCDWFPDLSDCVLRACAMHDFCYATHKCTASSWTDDKCDECDECNSDAMKEIKACVTPWGKPKLEQSFPKYYDAQTNVLSDEPPSPMHIPQYEAPKVGDWNYGVD